MSKLGYNSKRNEEASAKAAERLNAKISRNDALFANADFCDFLNDLANRAVYFQPINGCQDEYKTAALALREIVNGLVLNSSRGAEWLRAYAAQAATKPKSENNA